jgi:hypothetical protein
MSREAECLSPTRPRPAVKRQWKRYASRTTWKEEKSRPESSMRSRVDGPVPSSEARPEKKKEEKSRNRKGIERRSRNRSAIVVHLRVIQGSCGGIDSFSSPVASLQCRGRLVKRRDGSPGPDGKSGLGCVAEGACRDVERPLILVTAAAAARRRGPSCHAPRRVEIAGRASGRQERQASSARGGRRPRRSAQM